MLTAGVYSWKHSRQFARTSSNSTVSTGGGQADIILEEGVD